MRHANFKSSALVLLFIVILTVISFFPVLQSKFVNWDDQVHIYENALIRSLEISNIRSMFNSWVNGVYLPLTMLSFAVEYHFFGTQPFVYHLDNLLLHILVVVLLFWLARRMGFSRAAAGVAAVLFAVHPMRVESVAWATERKDVLYAFFYMLAVHSHVSFVRRAQGTPPAAGAPLFFWAGVTLACGVLSLLAKPMAVSLPAVLLLLDWYLGRKMSWKLLLEKLPLVLATAWIGWITYSLYVRRPETGLGTGILVWIWCASFYLRKFLWPLDLAPLYRLPESPGWLYGEYAIGCVLFLCLVAAVIVFRKSRLWIFAVAFYFISVFFLFRFDRYDTHLVADRFMYLPATGFCLLFGDWAARRTQRFSGKKRAVFITGLMVLAAGLSTLTFRQCRVWSNSVSLWQYQLARTPTEKIAMNNLANAFRERDDYKRLIQSYRRQKPLPLDALSAPGQSRPEFAPLSLVLELYLQAVGRDPQYAEAYYSLGCYWRDLGHWDKAAEVFRKTTAVDPYDFETHFNLAGIYRQQKKHALAVAEYSRTILLAPQDKEIYLRVMQELNQAVNQYPRETGYAQARKRIFELFRRFSGDSTAAGYFSLANYFRKQGDHARAVFWYERAMKRDPAYSSYFFSLFDRAPVNGK